MFDFLSMMGTYEQRKVKNTTINEVTVDTCAVTDSEQPYETGIASKLYNGGKWVIVEMYDSKREAEKGHEKWVKIFSDKKKFPKKLEDVSTANIIDFCKAIGASFSRKERTYKKQP